MERALFREEHEIFRRSFRAWLAEAVVPHLDAWEEAGQVSREVWREAGRRGFLCPMLPEEYGGAGADFLISTIVCEELSRARANGLTLYVHSDIIVPYLATYGTEEQRRRWLPGCAAGEIITAIAMTEPNTGSDLAALRTTARRDGDFYVLDGEKTFISNGRICDLVIVAAKTAPAADPPHAGVSLLVVEDGTPGFQKGRALKKMGLHSSDTAELLFSGCRVPARNLLGREGEGFRYLGEKLQQERLLVAIACQAAAEEALAETIGYCKERQAFGRAIASFQNTQFRLAELQTEVEVGRHFLDRLIADHAAGRQVVTESCMAKLWHSEMLKRLVDQCLQFYGGYGYMMEYEICKRYLDARAYPIFAGTSEIMKAMIAKRMGL